MKAAVLEAKRTMVCKEVPTPVPQEGEVLVRVAYCGVCGSDVPRYLDGAVHAFPLILGHEFSGVVTEVGPGVDKALVGTRMSGIPLIPCMNCPDCDEGNYSLCKTYGFVGSRRDGAYAEYVTLPAQNVFAISDDVDDFQAAFFEPASVAQHAVNMVAIRPETNAVIVGCGTIGIFVAQVLQAMGVRVTALARRESRLTAALAAGVNAVCDTSAEGWQQQLLAGLPRGGFDYVFDTSGSSSLMVDSFALAANKATVCFVGTPKRPMEFSVAQWERLNRKELLVTGSWMSYSFPFPGKEWQQVADGFASGTLRVVDEMIDSIYSLDEIPVGMEKFDAANKVSGKLLVKCQ